MQRHAKNELDAAKRSPSSERQARHWLPGAEAIRRRARRRYPEPRRRPRRHGGGVASGAACAVTPTETVGPYPSLIDLFRSDIRESKSGTQLDLAITVVNTATSCAPLAGVNVEIWQCDATGNYSQYGSERTQTYLRGIQTTDANGQVRFTTVYPGWYQGRATHIHVEVTRNGQSLKVTQIAFPDSINNDVHGSGVYASRGSNPTTNTRDMIFADSINSEMASVAGSPASGYSATFTVGLTA